MFNRYLKLILFVALTTLGCSRSKGKISVADQAARYSTAQQAADALNTAAQADDIPALEKIFGRDGVKLFNSGDSTADKNALRDFAKRMAEKYSVEPSEEESTGYNLIVGQREWPFPLPIVKGGNGWYFDVVSGAEEILDRRIGENELRTIRTLRTFVDAQREYLRSDLDGDGIREYAQRLASSPGKRDGLYWRSDNPKNQSPLGPFVAEAVDEGYRRKGTDPVAYHGYLFKPLYRQGASAPGGSRSFIDKRGNMTGGFALYAYPVRWGASGIMSFMVGTDGTVYQRDLGLETLAAAEKVEEFSPGSEWTPVIGDAEDLVDD